jgi:hypothetical protein
MKIRSGPWDRYSGRDPGMEAQTLKQRFQVVSRRSFRRRPPRWLRQPDWSLIAIIGALVALTILLGWRWSPTCGPAIMWSFRGPTCGTVPMRAALGWYPSTRAMPDIEKASTGIATGSHVNPTRSRVQSDGH